MEILTLLKANIRRRKGTFVSVVILMFIISMALTLILSVSKSCEASLNAAHSYAKSGNVIAMVKGTAFTDEMRKKLDDEAIIDHYRATPMAVISYGVDAPKEKSDISCFFSSIHDGIRLLNKNCTDYEDSIPPLSKGEIYMSYGTKGNLKCEIGDKITAHTVSGDYDFIIKGFVTEPVFGCMNIGWKWQFISQEDLDIISAANNAAKTDEKCSTGYVVELYKSDDCKLSDGKFRRQVNLDTDIIANSWGSLTKDMSMHYTNIYSDNTLGIMLIFILILAIVVLIVTGHSISTGIELDYTNLGILKSQGFSSTKIRISISLQYFIAEVIGSIIGIVCAIPLIRVLAGVFDPISGYITETHPALGTVILYLLCIFAASVVFILLITHKVCRISPIRAISGGRNEVYFDSRIKAPISSRFLSSTLALRQFTFARKRYVASIIIAAILVFFMLMVNALSDSTSSKKAMEMMGAEITDVNIKFNEKTDKAEIDKVLDIIEKKSEINKRCFHYGVNISLNGEEIFCSVNNYPEDTLVKKGRAPLYDNEIVITEMVADELDLKIGDTIDAARFDKHEQFIVSGIYVSLYDTGMAVSINADAGKKLGIEAKVTNGGVNLKNSEDAEKVRAALEKEYGNKAEITLTDPDDDLGLINNAVRAMRIIIYAFSLFFALIVVSMVSSKAFTQEKTDIGIFKSQGFTTGKLRLQFAIRFFIVSVIGAILGTFTGTLLINKVLSLLLRGIGITNFYTSFTITGILMPAAAICICFFIFALIVSRKIKKVGIRQLITE
ncbi:ABC transporter permease [Ruminococcus flavefaciens]|uniref:ABC-type transport system, involved in lipoprotein release, permease component n=1 Tax=Ruminococcus flavefaciens TaxID=1265 RepID=A0A1M7KG19_RUMFL|nr:FtsX-like permease family protein [Ruminococcus flavefaciens]SHM64228.1 ABC-type transport system, involved in lipoprotein release, permease component [Ruminococcus flavefaciens]